MPARAIRKWTFGVLGPVAAVTATPRFQYHSLLGNVLFVALCGMVLVAPGGLPIGSLRAQRDDRKGSRRR